MKENMFRKILVVDDEEAMQDVIILTLKKLIQQKGCEFDVAGNGQEALEKVKNDDSISLILLDMGMPVMDGMTFLVKLKELNKPLIKTIVISGYNDMKSIRSAMNLGAFDFVIKPIDFNDLAITVEKGLNYDQEYLKDALLKREEFLSLQKELDIAANIQSSMVPTDYPAFPEISELDIHGRMIPAKTVGGDLYDFFSIDKHRVGIVVGDVSGKGVAAAIFMVRCITIIRSIGLRGVSVDTCLEIVNNELFKNRPKTFYVTVFYGILDTRSGSFKYCCCGHPPPCLVSSDGNVTQLENVGGGVVGMFQDVVYESRRIVLKPGETLFAFTDGILEARGKEEEEFGVQRLQNCLQKVSGLPIDQVTGKVVDEVKAFTQGEQFDDITCLAMRYQGK